MLYIPDNNGPRPQIDDNSFIIGVHDIIEFSFNGRDISPYFAAAQQRIAQNPKLAAAYVDISMMLQSHNRTEDAMNVLNMALDLSRDYCIVYGDGSGPQILAFVIPGDFMANTPLDFLLQGSNAVLWLHYVNDETREINCLPHHDIAFMAVGEGNDSKGVLQKLQTMLADYPKPILNNRPEFISSFTRDGVSNLLKDAKHIVCPMNYRTSRIELLAAMATPIGLKAISPQLDFPVIVRPIGTHAGHGMEKVTSSTELSAALEQTEAQQFYIVPFIDYRDENGWFNKQRIVFLEGKPFASHMALSRNWMVHYMNAEMAGNEKNRAIEADWMENFDNDFAIRYKAAFEELYQIIGLDYFGIDSAILPDGRLLVFELDVAMIVHDMDSAELFPYKKPTMHKLFKAFVETLERRSLILERRSIAVKKTEISGVG